MFVMAVISGLIFSKAAFKFASNNHLFSYVYVNIYVLWPHTFQQTSRTRNFHYQQKYSWSINKLKSVLIHCPHPYPFLHFFLFLRPLDISCFLNMKVYMVKNKFLYELKFKYLVGGLDLFYFVFFVTLKKWKVYPELCFIK